MTFNFKNFRKTFERQNLGPKKKKKRIENLSGSQLRGKLAAIDGRRNKPSVSLLTLHLSNQRCGLQPPASDQKAINCLHASRLIFSAAAAARLISGGRLTRVARVCSSHSNRTRHLIAPPPPKKKKKFACMQIMFIVRVIRQENFLRWAGQEADKFIFRRPLQHSQPARRTRKIVGLSTVNWRPSQAQKSLFSGPHH